jgi:type I restriction enzyme M protein
MLYKKYIPDVNKKKAEYMLKHVGDETRVDRAMSHERFKVPENSSFDYINENRNADNQVN